MAQVHVLDLEPERSVLSPPCLGNRSFGRRHAPAFAEAGDLDVEDDGVALRRRDGGRFARRFADQKWRDGYVAFARSDPARVLATGAPVILVRDRRAARDKDHGREQEYRTMNATSARAFREWAQLDSNPATVAASLARGSTYTDHTFGIPLTPSERAKVSAIMAAQDRLVPVHQDAQRQPGYVGSYLERNELVVLTSEPAARMEEALRSKLPPGASLRVEAAANTRGALETAKSEILLSGAIGLVSVGISDRDGVVQVGVEPETNALVQSLQDRYGALVRIEVESPIALLACNSRHDCGTMGGLTARQDNVLGTNRCTTAFIIKWGSSSHKMLTAGHCIAKFGLGSPTPWKNWVQNVTWGVNRAQNFCNGCNTDSGVFDIPTVPADRDQYFLATGPRDLVGTYLDSALPVGKQICGTRSIGDYACGLITQVDTSVDVDDGPGQFWTHHSWVMGLQSYSGDSGAGMVGFDAGDNIRAAGVLFGGTSASPWKTYFSSIQRVQAYHGITVCTTDAC